MNRQMRIPGAIAAYAPLVGVLIALCAGFGLLSEHFFSQGTIRLIARQVPALLIVSTGMTFVLLSGGIDLSVGSVLALCSAVFALALDRTTAPLPIAAACCIGAGLATGSASGLLIARWRVPSFIVTLGMLEMARGLCYILTDSRTIYLGSKVEALADAAPLGVPLTFAIAGGTVAAAHVVLTRTVFGRQLVASGWNERAAFQSGVPVARIRFAVFALAGALAGLGALVQTIRIGAAQPGIGVGFELEAIAAVVVGGTSLSGGRGSVIRTVFGVLIITVLGSGLSQIGAAEPARRFVTGGVIVLAVILDRLRERAESGPARGAKGG